MDDFDFLQMLDNKHDMDEIELDKLIRLSQHKDAEIRNWTAVLLSPNYSPEAEQTLLALLKDKDYLVRTNACDSLGESSNKEIIPILLGCLSDKSELVRGYAALSVADIALSTGSKAGDIIKSLENAINNEKKKWTSVCYYEALYRMGEEKYFDHIVKELKNRDYIVRICAVSALKEIKNCNNKQAIDALLIEMLNKEDSVAVKSKIKSDDYNINP